MKMLCNYGVMVSFHCGNRICRLFHAIPYSVVPLQPDAAVVLLWESSIEGLFWTWLV
jgi:hypothetical protein